MLPSDSLRFLRGKGVVSMYLAFGFLLLVCLVVAVCAFRRGLYMDGLELGFMKIFNFKVSVKEKRSVDCRKQSKERSSRDDVDSPCN